MTFFVIPTIWVSRAEPPVNSDNFCATKKKKNDLYRRMLVS